MPPVTTASTCCPKDVIQQSIIALYGQSPTTVTGYTNNVMPTGRYLAPASGPDCVQYLSGMCPGTALTRIVTGPLYGKLDMSFVKRFSLPKNMKIEARMDLYNVLNTVNFNAIAPTSATPGDGLDHGHGQLVHQLAGHVGRAGRERLAGPGRTRHVVRPAFQLVGAVL